MSEDKNIKISDLLEESEQEVIKEEKETSEKEETTNEEKEMGHKEELETENPEVEIESESEEPVDQETKQAEETVIRPRRRRSPLVEEPSDIYASLRSRKVLTKEISAIERFRQDGEPTECAIIFYENYKVIIPISAMGFKNPDSINMRSLVGAEIDFVVIGINNDDTEALAPIIAVGSREIAMTIKRRLLKRRNIREGSLVRARIVGVGRQNAIVEAYGIETSVPAGELAWGHVSRAGQFVQTGEEHLAYVKSVDADEGELELSLRLANQDPFEIAINKYKVRGEYKAEITGIKEFGIFVGFEQGVQGLCPIPNWMDFSPGLGDIVLVTIVSIKPDKRQINGRLMRIIRRAQ